MSGREIEAIAAGMYGKKWNDPDPTQRPGDKMKDVWRKYAADGLSGLTAAGYRIVGPGELDAATVERCAQIARDAHVSHRPGGLDAYNCDIATALRNLQEGKP